MSYLSLILYLRQGTSLMKILLFLGAPILKHFTVHVFSFWLFKR